MQLVISAVWRLSASVEAVRFTMLALAALAVGAALVLCGRIFDRASAPISAALLASNMLFIALATVPYQEVLFAFLVFVGLYFHARGGVDPRE